jgi:SNF2 family DNA or RNA helicase
LNYIGIGCHSLQVGQHIECSERAVNEWKSTLYLENSTQPFIPYPVLLVQARAAASGLTLTAAHKIFLMEPFTHHSKEL